MEGWFLRAKNQDTGRADGWMDGWMDGWVGGWVGGKAGLRIAYSNKKQDWLKLVSILL